MLNEDVLKYIISYVNCSSKLYLVNKFFYNNFKCRIIKYKKLCTCLLHKNYDLYNVIRELKRHKIDKNIKSMHFDSSNQLEIAKPYLSLFGDVSHYCCSNTGVMFNCNKCKLNKLENMCICFILPPKLENKNSFI